MDPKPNGGAGISVYPYVGALAVPSCVQSESAQRAFAVVEVVVRVVGVIRWQAFNDPIFICCGWLDLGRKIWSGSADR